MSTPQLGLFQLEGLAVARPSFIFLDIRVQPQIVTVPRVQSILSLATPVRSHDVQTHLENDKVRPDDPVILLCEDGRLSQSIAAELERAGFRQIYVVEGGLDGLLREATASG